MQKRETAGKSTASEVPLCFSDSAGSPMTTLQRQESHGKWSVNEEGLHIFNYILQD
jgi:hypothetical protein